MKLSEVSINKPVFAWMLMAALLIFGGISFKRMGVSQLPDVDFPVASVNVTLEGAAPEVMELDVVDPIEDALMGIQGIRAITSSSRTGSANISVEFELSKNVDVGVQEIQNVLAQVQRRLPREVDPPVVSKSNPEDQPILWLAVTSDKLADKDLMALVRDRIKDRFTTVPGVGEVFLGGYIDPALRVWVSSQKLDRYELTIPDIIRTIQNEHAELPGGRIEMPERELNVRTMGEAPTAEQFARLSISSRGGGPNFVPIPLNAVARVEEGLSDIRRKSRSGGKPAVGLGIRKQRGANAVEVARFAKERMKEVAPLLPEGTHIGVRFDLTTFIEDSVHELNFTLLLSAALTALVCWLFLGSLSATLNVVLAIPTSVVGSFIVLYFLGFTLNSFSLLGLSLSIGIVVDDAIMVLENIVRHAEMGKKKRQAALDGTREIAFAALAATAAIIAIFLPVAFMKGIIGKFFFQFGVTLSVAVALSLLEALTLTPMRCSQYLNAGQPRTSRIGRFVDGGFEWATQAYRRIIGWLVDHPWRIVALSFVFCALTFSLVRFLRKEMSPAQDQSRLMIRMQAPVGSSLAHIDSKFTEAENIILAHSEVLQSFGSIGGFGGGDVNTAMMFVSLKPKRERALSQQQLADQLREELRKIKGLRSTVQDPSQAGFSSKRGFPVEFTVRGPDWEGLVEASRKLMAEMQKSPNLADVDSDYLAGLPEVRVVPDRERARAQGVSVGDIAETVRAGMGGVIAGKFSKGGHRYDVRVRLDLAERGSPEDIKKLKVRNNRGELVLLGSLVKLEERPSLQSISRVDRERAVTVFANVATGKSQQTAIEDVKRLASQVLPEGYRAVPAGSAQSMNESFEGLVLALVLGLVVSYMVLASQFNSFVHPLTVLIALPFSVSGAFVSLLAFGQSLNIFSMIGLVLLMGIVKKNSILLVDFTNQVRERGGTVREALIEACPMRLRPILMTSVATVAGALPAAFALGPGAETTRPMAIAVIGGVTVSTALTLFAVPSVYRILSRFSDRSAEKSHDAG